MVAAKHYYIRSRWYAVRGGSRMEVPTSRFELLRRLARDRAV